MTNRLVFFALSFGVFILFLFSPVCRLVSALLTIHRIRAGGRQTVLVQHVQVSGSGNAVVAGNVNGSPSRELVGGV
jgi:hypothetical protein